MRPLLRLAIAIAFASFACDSAESPAEALSPVP